MSTENTPLISSSEEEATAYGISNVLADNLLFSSNDGVSTSTDFGREKLFDYEEAKFLTKKAAPLLVAYLLQYTLQVANVFSLGRLGSNELAASALGSMFAAVTCWSVGLGAASALDTLCSQAYTSGTPIMVGVHLQRGVIIVLIGMMPIAMLWWEAERILVVLGQDKELSKMAGVYLRYLLPGAPAYLLFECVKKYLQAQGIMQASTYVLIICAPINLVLNYTLVLYKPIALGFIGAPLAITIVNWLMLISIVLYIRFFDGYQVWGGWTCDALRDWRTFIQLAIPGILMVCSQYWSYELIALAAGYLGSITLASHSIVLTSALLLYQAPYGIAVATSNRVGNLLGAGLASKAQVTARVAMFLAVLIALVNSTVLMVFKDSWGYLFTSDDEVVKMVATLLPLCAAFQELNAVGVGILCGQGKQRVGAIFTMVGYLFALILGLVFEFRYYLGIKGLWTALTCASIAIAIAVIWTILVTDWQWEVERCRKRMKIVDHNESRENV
ncbi:9245_t:CDS:2 [Ambispora gerdemannii]|uniref:9245_t:CDS:1 n=1 Tax=Ambispora gerdemannii TaxID=144530 RepID=A0A9N8YMV0_9GLOM|nr:9245_t:CDS:2 [Ambispora gerdemannii]